MARTSLPAYDVDVPSYFPVLRNGAGRSMEGNADFGRWIGPEGGLGTRLRPIQSSRGRSYRRSIAAEDQSILAHVDRAARYRRRP